MWSARTRINIQHLDNLQVMISSNFVGGSIGRAAGASLQSARAWFWPVSYTSALGCVKLRYFHRDAGTGAVAKLA
jgi:hypothetical protein